MTTTPIIITAEIDFAYNNDLETILEHLWREYHIGVAVVRASGSAGGWPVVKLIGNRDDVERALRGMWSTGDAQDDDALVCEMLA